MSSRAQAVIIGGVFSGVLSALPYISVANCCCLWLISGGIVTAYLIQREQSEPLDLSTGAVSGALAGIVAACVYVIVSLPIQLLLAPLQSAPTDLFTPSADVPPEVLELVRNVVTNPLLLVMFGFVVMIFVGTIFSALGGLLGALFFHSRQQAGYLERDTVPQTSCTQ